MKINRTIFYLVTLILFTLTCLSVPQEFNIFSFITQPDINIILTILILFSGFISLISIYSSTQIEFLEIVLLILACFIIATFTIKLPLSLGTLLIIVYAYKIRKNTELLKYPDPAYSTNNNLPSLFFLVGLFAGLLLWFTAKPDFQPENFAPLDALAEASLGCSPEQGMEECIEDRVKEQSNYDGLINQCDDLPPIQHGECITQVETRFQETIEQAKAQYSQEFSLNNTVSQVFREMAADQINDLAQNNREVFRILLAIAVFSIISGMGGLVNLLVSPLTSMLTGLLISLGTIQETTTTEEVTHYFLE